MTSKQLRLLMLNCQRGYNSSLNSFLLEQIGYDFLLLQEVSPEIFKTLKKMKYGILRLFDSDLGELSQLCILYNKKHRLKSSTLTSFAKLNPSVEAHSWGLLHGVFEINKTKITVGTVHLHSGLQLRTRMQELKIIKGKLSKHNGVAVFGGDFNAGFPLEPYFGSKILSSFKRISNNLGNTLNSRYTEYAPHFYNKVSFFLSKIGVGLSFPADQVYVNDLTAKKFNCHCTKLPVRISDHTPVEIIINKLK